MLIYCRGNKNLLISNKSEHCWDKRGRHNGVWLITLQTLGAARARAHAQVIILSHYCQPCRDHKASTGRSITTQRSHLQAGAVMFASTQVILELLFHDVGWFYWIYCRYYFLRNLFFCFIISTIFNNQNDWFFFPIKGWKQPIMNEQQLAVKKTSPIQNWFVW